MREARKKAAGLAVVALLRLVSWLPLPVSRVLGKWTGLINYAFNTRAAKVTRANLEVCMPEKDEAQREALVRESLINTGQTALETPAAWLGRFSRINRWISSVEGESLVEDAVAEGRGVIVLLLHLGNWEMFNVYCGAHHKVTALYNPPRQDYLIDVMRRIRHGFGNELVPANVKGVATLYRRLAEGRMIVILPDQVPASGVYAPFFGLDALTDKLVPRLVRKTGARVVLTYVRRRPGLTGFDVVFRAPVPEIYANDLHASATALNASIEAAVREVPAQYQWEYKRFRERPAGERKLYRFGRHEYH